ncbi:MurR/RpiR family transcriptional regulator [Roseococcus sp.]|uniref:MurR/RpiR family transcriptional regulator n=1 Tax=Roseococcus sp. TaxID=2109646 RepID=UPI003BAB55EB
MRVIAQLEAAARQLSPRLAAAARYVAEHPFDAATLPMRELARRSGEPAANFTRLAQALGHPGWEELRAGLVEAARTAPSAPYSDHRPARDGLVEAVLAADAQSLAALGAQDLAPPPPSCWKPRPACMSRASAAATPPPPSSTTTIGSSGRR